MTRNQYDKRSVIQSGIEEDASRDLKESLTLKPPLARLPPTRGTQGCHIVLRLKRHVLGVHKSAFLAGVLHA